MILKGFKEKSIKKQINKLLSEQQAIVTKTKIESLGIIFNLDEVDDFEQFRSLSTYLKILPNKVKIIAFSQKNKIELKSWDVCYSSTDLGWYGVIKNSELQTFLNTKFDALISYYETDVAGMKLLNAVSKAQFKISIFQKDERLNNLIIKTKVKEFDVFKIEIFKYLTTLNIIKNE